MATTRKLDPEPPVVAEMVTVRITKKGDGKVSNGNHIATLGDEYFDTGETPMLPRDTAEALEERGFVEIQDTPMEPAPPPHRETPKSSGL